MSGKILGIIGGSGLGDVFVSKMSDIEQLEVKTPFGSCSGKIVLGKLEGGSKVAFINRHGDGHRYGPGEVPYAANIWALKKVGVRAIISSCAVGSLREEIRPGNLVIIDQFIDKTYRRMSSFFGEYGAVHCEMAQSTCGRLRQFLISVANGIEGVVTHDKGTYVCMEGPGFSTRAESLMHRTWGGDLIGMTAMPEAKLAREAQICYALVALASDYDCWREQEAGKDKQTLLAEIIGNLEKATNNAIRLVEAAAKSDAAICDDSCPCRKSLELAVWTREDIIAAEAKDKLSILLSRDFYFKGQVL